MPVSPELARSYRYWRQHTSTASQALSYARYQADQREVLSWFSSFTFGDAGYGSFAYADYQAWSWGEVADSWYEGANPDEGEGFPMTVRVLVGHDDHGVEWGDCEPTDEVRERAEAFYVALVVEDHDGAEVFHDGIGGIDVIDLPGYLQRDFEDAAAFALIEYLDLPRALRIATTEAREAVYWAARDVMTVS